MRICLVRPWRRSLGTLEITRASQRWNGRRIIIRIQTWQRTLLIVPGSMRLRLRSVRRMACINLSRSSILNELQRSKMRSGYRLCFTAAPDFPERIFQTAIAHGISKINIFTDINIAAASAAAKGTRRRKDCNDRYYPVSGRGCGRGDEGENEAFWLRGTRMKQSMSGRTK